MSLIVPTLPDALPVDELIAHIATRYQQVHRRDLPELIELADTVTEMTEIKHAYTSGIRAMRGIDY